MGYIKTIHDHRSYLEHPTVGQSDIYTAKAYNFGGIFDDDTYYWGEHDEIGEIIPDIIEYLKTYNPVFDEASSNYNDVTVY
jgi:hypothetical protein